MRVGLRLRGLGAELEIELDGIEDRFQAVLTIAAAAAAPAAATEVVVKLVMFVDI